MLQVLRDLEAERLEAAGTRLRIQREKEELRKKESQIKLTDRPPPQKRSRGCKFGAVIYLGGY